MTAKAAPAADKLLADPPPPDPTAAAESSADKDTAPEAPKRSHKRRADAPAGPKRGPGRPPKPKIGERLGGMIAGLGVGVAAFNQSDGFAIVAGADELGMALEKWAEESPAVRRVLENLLEASAAGMVLVAVSKIAIPIAANHELLPGNLAAVVAAGNHGPMPVPTPAEPSNGNSAN